MRSLQTYFFLVSDKLTITLYCDIPQETQQYKARKGVSPDTPSHIIQKHYEFYLANKIKSYRYVNYSQLDIFCWLFLLRHFESALFAFAIAFALSANVVAEHGSEYEILFWTKLV